jgi:hypothetical protein
MEDLNIKLLFEQNVMWGFLQSFCFQAERRRLAGLHEHCFGRVGRSMRPGLASTPAQQTCFQTDPYLLQAGNSVL